MTRGAREIARVAELALFKINQPENAAKGSWRAMSRRRIFWLLLVEVWELGVAMWTLHRLRRLYDRAAWQERPDLVEPIQAARRAVQHEAGDCVAFLAFLVDRT